MQARISRMRKAGVFLALTFAMALPVAGQNNEILGEVRFQPENRAAKTAGVWVDGRYVGYLSELKGSKKLLLLPGEHEISVRQAGYQSVEQKISVQPNAVQTLRVSLAKDPRAQFPTVSAEVRLSIDPDRAADDCAWTGADERRPYLASWKCFDEAEAWPGAAAGSGKS